MRVTPFTPLFIAVNQAQVEAVVEMLRANADPNATGPDGNPVLFKALPFAPTLKALLEAGADPNRRTPQGVTPLWVAVQEGRQPAVELLLAHKADVNATVPGDGWTGLHLAAGSGSKPITELLLKAGADVNARTKVGDTPLHFAVNPGKRELAELLLANKADPNARNNSGKTPLDLAKSQPQPVNPMTAQGQASKPDTMADLLRRYGAMDDLPKLDRIDVSRRSTGYSDDVFWKGSNDWSHFTLLELLGVEYGLLARSSKEAGGAGYQGSAFFSAAWNSASRVLGFPDLARLRLRRPAPDRKSWQEQTIDFGPVLESGECSKDVRLEWGDVVEIPEADHPLNER